MIINKVLNNNVVTIISENRDVYKRQMYYKEYGEK